MQTTIDILFLISQTGTKERQVWSLIGGAVEKHLDFGRAVALDKGDDFTVFSSPVVSIFNCLYY